MATFFDLLAFGTIIICMVVSWTRGAVSEVFDFGGWIVSLLFARWFAVPVADVVFPSMNPRQMAVVCAFVLMFTGMRLLQYLLRFALNSYIGRSKLTGVNRLMGAALGALKGILFVSIGVFVCSFSRLPESDVWREAASSEFFETLVKTAVPHLPEFVGDQVYFPARTREEEQYAERQRRNRHREVEKMTPKGY